MKDNKYKSIKEKKMNKMLTIKDTQDGLLRPVLFQQVEKINRGKATKSNIKFVTGVGIQFENKVFLTNGKFKYANKTSIKLKDYKIRPEDTELTELYNKILKEKGENKI